MENKIKEAGGGKAVKLNELLYAKPLILPPYCELSQKLTEAGFSRATEKLWYSITLDTYLNAQSCLKLIGISV